MSSIESKDTSIESKETPKTGVRPKVPITAPEADSSKDASKENKPAPKRENRLSINKPTSTDIKKLVPGGGNRGRQQSTQNSRGRMPDHRTSRDNSDVRQPSREVCRLFLRNQCKLGNRCKYFHPGATSSYTTHDDSRRRRSSPMHTPSGKNPGAPMVCRDFIRNKCTRGSGCRFYHPPMEAGGHQDRVSWFTFCHDFLMGCCMRPDCSLFHISKQDEEMYRMRGEISPQLVEQAVHKSLVEDLALIGTRPCCKEFLRGLCTMPNCRLRHLSQREYEDEVFYALLEELEYMLGPPDSRPFTPPPVNFYEPNDAMPDSIRPPLMPGCPEDMMPMNEPSNLPPPNYEPERKRARYHPNDSAFPVEEPRRWDDRDQVDYERDRPEFPVDSDSLMQEILTLRNENMDLRRSAESKIDELKDELNRVAQENSKLHADAVEITVAHKSEMKNLTATNTTLVEDRRKAQEAVRELEHNNNELRRAIDGRVKAACMELEKKLDTAKFDVEKARESFTKANALLRKNEDERSKLVTEIGDLKAKLHDLHGAATIGSMGKELQQFSKELHQYGNKSGFSKRDGYSREMDARGRWLDTSAGDVGPRDGRDHRSNSTWDQDMHTMDILSKSKYQDMRNKDSNNSGMGAPQYGNVGVGGYSRRGDPKESLRKDTYADTGKVPLWQTPASGNSMQGQWPPTHNEPNTTANRMRPPQPTRNPGYSTSTVPPGMEPPMRYEGTSNDRNNRDPYNNRDTGRHSGSWQYY